MNLCGVSDDRVAKQMARLTFRNGASHTAVISEDSIMKSITVFAIAVALVVLFVIAVGRPAFGTTRYISQAAGTFSGGQACNGQTTITPATFNADHECAG